MPHNQQGFTKGLETKTAVSLKSNPTLYRVELLISDNPAASHHTPSRPRTLSYPLSTIVALPLLSLSLSRHLVPLSLFILYCHKFLSLQPFSCALWLYSVSFHMRVACLSRIWPIVAGICESVCVL